MRRRYLVPFVVAGLLLLALGAVPSTLKSGDPYYLSADPVDDPDAVAGTNVTAVNVTDVTEARWPYTMQAIAEGRSDGYWKGPMGIKGAFTHSPFDEMGAYRTQYPEATVGDAVYVKYNGTAYRLSVIR